MVLVIGVIDMSRIVNKTEQICTVTPTSFGSWGDASFLARLIFFTLLHESISSGRLT